MEPKQAVLWMQMQRDAKVAACMDSTSRMVEVWGRRGRCWRWRWMSGKTVRGSREMAGDWDPDTEMHK